MCKVIFAFLFVCISFFIGIANAQLKIPHLEGLDIRLPRLQSGPLSSNVLIKWKGIPWCGGTLINNQIVLTAGHCVIDSQKSTPEQLVKKSELSVVTNVTFIKHPIFGTSYGDEQSISLENMEPHPNYKPSPGYYDIAMIKLPKPVKSSDYRFPELATDKVDSGDNLTPYSLLYVPGFGVTEFNEQLTNRTDVPYVEAESNVLRYGIMPLISESECGSERAWRGFLGEPSKSDSYIHKTLCYGIPTSGTITGKGDSGAGVYSYDSTNGKLYLVAVHFAGLDSQYKYSVGSRVSQFLDWIEKTQKSLKGR